MITLITGKGSVGKSTLAEGLCCLNLDEIVRTKFEKDFDIYTQNPSPKKDSFIEYVRNILSNYTHIEGSIKDFEVIRKLFHGMQFNILYVIPKDAETYQKMIYKRFMENDGCARLGYLQRSDDKKVMLKMKEENQSEIIMDWIHKVAIDQYDIAVQLQNDFQNEFGDLVTIYETTI